MKRFEKLKSIALSQPKILQQQKMNEIKWFKNGCSECPESGQCKSSEPSPEAPNS
ncbi:hypothetical protein PPEP_a2634 [Pseudoalteromonas peptidolytica F12-50-A1]|uniref:Uncharacterized protein n=1 Tax=Pseudoalteromonas peptidolytica F12-50-A1 TaxID=1315280 RepID=A0A8I0MTH5_9GAMM|nr:hypothetical protein [Pseudoalteromonas sp. J010]MBE0344939.1 hypothetical protein [Pseudoalteromonas peptidolytica F12-50-A1]